MAETAVATRPPQRAVGKRPAGVVAGIIVTLAYWIAHCEEQSPTDWKCVKWLQEKHPELSNATCWRYVRHAHEMLASPMGERIAGLRGEIIMRLESRARDPKLEVKWRLKADEQLADILGINAPQRMEVATVHLQAAKSAKQIDWNEFARMQAHQIPAVPTSAVPPTIESAAEVKQLPPINVPIEDQPETGPCTAMVQSEVKSTT